MSKYKLFYCFILIILISISKEEDILDIFNVKIDNTENSDQTGSSCLCDIERDSCNYLCCCDTKCDGDIIKEWDKRSKCIDSKDTINIFSDRCIDKNLIYKVNSRRGLKSEEATEDISSSTETITNLCFSMDNSKKMTNIIKDVNLDINSIHNNEQQSTLRNLESNNTDDEIFSKNGNFSLYSGGQNCINFGNVEKLINENYSCYMNESKNDKIKDAINNGINITIQNINVTCKLNKIYSIEEGILNITPLDEDKISNEDRIFEVEFIIQAKNYDDFGNCSINVVKAKKTNEIKYIFKNSVIFSKTGNILYKYSGTNGYLNGYPLKISIENFVFNEFYLIGRKENGICRTDDNIYNYLYNYDKPILFNQNYSYSCSLNKTEATQIENTTLYKKLLKIDKIAKFGNSRIKNINNEKYWLKVDKSGLNASNINNTLIKMNVYLGTKKIGIHSYKYIYKVILKSIEREKQDELTLDINFYDLDRKLEYEQTPDIPAFIPSMPPDLLDPLIYSNVDK